MRNTKDSERWEAIAATRDALWMAEKLARLCRECVRARGLADARELERLGEEITALLVMERFQDALACFTPDFFEPPILRRLLASLEDGEADSIDEAVRRLDGAR